MLYQETGKENMDLGKEELKKLNNDFFHRIDGLSTDGHELKLCFTSGNDHHDDLIPTRYAAKRSRTFCGYDYYMSINTYKKQSEEHTRCRDNILNSWAMAVDIDANDHHKAHIDPTDDTFDMAMSIITRLPEEIRPTDVAVSGGGLHIYWMFSKTMTACRYSDMFGKTIDPAAMYNKLARRLNQLVQDGIEKAGLDSVFHACKPITYNHLIRKPNSRNQSHGNRCTMIWSLPANAKTFFELYNIAMADVVESIKYHMPRMVDGIAVLTDQQILEIAARHDLSMKDTESFIEKVPYERRGSMTEEQLVKYLRYGWNAKRPKRTRTVKGTSSYSEYYSKVYSDLDILASAVDLTGKRNYLCYSQAIYLSKAGMGKEQVEEMVKAFNSHLIEPLPEREVLACIKSGVSNAPRYHQFSKAMIYSFSRIEDDIKEAEEKGFSFAVLGTKKKDVDPEKDHRASMKRANKQKQARREKKRAVFEHAREMADMGLSISEIARRMHMSRNTVSKYLNADSFDSMFSIRKKKAGAASARVFCRLLKNCTSIKSSIILLSNRPLIIGTDKAESEHESQARGFPYASPPVLDT
jgi:AraC-like DNA-binding protein